MNALRLIVLTLLREAIVGQDKPQPVARIYDPYSLATRPLPANLQLFPHPKQLSEADVLRITGGLRVES